ncbi:protein of unknown function [Cyanobium sp. NIES-981]|nr:protein of unknown function [Cyanobium sp. NIES-981]
MHGSAPAQASGSRLERAARPPMLRLHGNRLSLLAALTAHWAQGQLNLPALGSPSPGAGLRRPGEGSDPARRRAAGRLSPP